MNITIVFIISYIILVISSTSCCHLVDVATLSITTISSSQYNGTQHKNKKCCTEFSITTLSITVKMPHSAKRLWIQIIVCWMSHFYSNAECHCSECCYADCRYAKCRGTILSIAFGVQFAHYLALVFVLNFRQTFPLQNFLCHHFSKATFSQINLHLY